MPILNRLYLLVEVTRVALLVLHFLIHIANVLLFLGDLERQRRARCAFLDDLLGFPSRSLRTSSRSSSNIMVHVPNIYMKDDRRDLPWIEVRERLLVNIAAPCEFRFALLCISLQMRRIVLRDGCSTARLGGCLLRRGGGTGATSNLCVCLFALHARMAR